MTESTEPTKSTETPALVVDSLHHSFKDHKAVQGVSFTVANRAIHGFVGPNGAGKTTTLKCIATLLKPDYGRLRVFGFDTDRQVYEVRRRLGFMPDHFSMYRQMSVFEYLDFFAAAYGLGLNERNKVIADVLALTDMSGRRDDLIQGLSRGMQQRVSLARLLVNDPSLLLLDEPASGLDPRARIELMEIIRELRNMGKTIFISSHILSELADLCDSVTIIDRGKVKYTGSMNELLRHSTHELVYEIQLTQIDDAIIQSIEKIEGINKVTRREDKPILTIAFDDQKLSRRDLLQKTLETGADIQSFKESQRQLNQVFMDLTDPGVRS